MHFIYLLEKIIELFFFFYLAVEEPSQDDGSDQSKMRQNGTCNGAIAPHSGVTESELDLIRCVAIFFY